MKPVYKSHGKREFIGVPEDDFDEEDYVLGSPKTKLRLTREPSTEIEAQQPVCRFYASGNCSAKATCPNLHTVPPIDGLCPFFRTRECRSPQSECVEFHCHDLQEIPPADLDWKCQGCHKGVLQGSILQPRVAFLCGHDVTHHWSCATKCVFCECTVKLQIFNSPSTNGRRRQFANSHKKDDPLTHCGPLKFCPRRRYNLHCRYVHDDALPKEQLRIAVVGKLARFPPEEKSARWVETRSECCICWADDKTLLIGCPLPNCKTTCGDCALKVLEKNEVFKCPNCRTKISRIA